MQISMNIDNSVAQDILALAVKYNEAQCEAVKELATTKDMDGLLALTDKLSKSHKAIKRFTEALDVSELKAIVEERIRPVPVEVPKSEVKAEVKPEPKPEPKAEPKLKSWELAPHEKPKKSYIKDVPENPVLWYSGKGRKPGKLCGNCALFLKDHCLNGDKCTENHLCKYWEKKDEKED